MGVVVTRVAGTHDRAAWIGFGCHAALFYVSMLPLGPAANKATLLLAGGSFVIVLCWSAFLSDPARVFLFRSAVVAGIFFGIVVSTMLVLPRDVLLNVQAVRTILVFCSGVTAHLTVLFGAAWLVNAFAAQVRAAHVVPGPAPGPTD